MDKIKIIIVDDSEIFRKALRTFLEKIEGLEVIAEACNGKEFLEIIKNFSVDIVLMDVLMPVMDGVEAIQNALKLYPSLNIIALTTYENQEFFDSVIKSGAKGFIDKNEINEKLESLLKSII